MSLPKARLGLMFDAEPEAAALLAASTRLGAPCVAVNAGPGVAHSEAMSFQLMMGDQVETDFFWNTIIGAAGSAGRCNWCKDPWGVFWRITPRTLSEAMAAGGADAPSRRCRA
ncbi:MAG: VOC family protein [Pseudomonadota bacterium]